MGLDEEIQQGDPRLQELMSERVQLREKSTMLEAEIKKLEEGIKKDFLDKNTMVIEQDEINYIDRLWDYYQEFINLMHWI